MVDTTQQARFMTVAELTELRLAKKPILCQQMWKATSSGALDSDIEEYSQQALDTHVAQLKQDGWRCNGKQFTRTYKE